MLSASLRSMILLRLCLSAGQAPCLSGREVAGPSPTLPLRPAARAGELTLAGLVATVEAGPDEDRMVVVPAAASEFMGLPGGRAAREHRLAHRRHRRTGTGKELI